MSIRGAARLAGATVVVAAVVAAAVGAGTASAAARFPSGFRRIVAGPAGGAVWRGPIPGATRPSMIYVPPGFTTARRYPVAYLLPGMPGSPWSYVNGLSLASVADTLIGHRLARPFIAVIPVAGKDGHYAGEWAGPWEQYVVDHVVPWVDANLPTVASAQGRMVAGLSAGGFGAVDIALRHPTLFGTIESWGGYFVPFRDGPLANASPAQLAAHDPTTMLPALAAQLRHASTRFFLSSGPGHGAVHESATPAFARDLRLHGLPATLELIRGKRGMWERQLVDGLRWAFSTRAG